MRNEKIVFRISIIILTSAFLLTLHPVSLALKNGGAIIDPTILLIRPPAEQESAIVQDMRVTDITPAQNDYIHASPEGNFSRNAGAFYNFRDVKPGVVPAAHEVIQSTEILTQPSNQLKFVGMVRINGDPHWTFKSNEIQTAGIFRIGTQWRGWTLIEVEAAFFTFEYQNRLFVIGRD